MFRFRKLITPISSKSFIATPHLRNSTSTIAWRNFATYKTTTGLAGVPVDPDGRENLIKYAAQVLRNIEKFPDCGYKQSVVAWYTFIAKTAEENTEIKAIEDEIALGHIEEVILIAKGELQLIEQMYDVKIWERVAKAKAEADELISKMSDAIFFSTPHLRNPKKYPPPGAAPASAPGAATGAASTPPTGAAPPKK